jgi:hypothetical protein
MDFQEVNKQKEIEDFIKAYSKIMAQIKYPSRDGMIDALREALTVAQFEIRTIEISQKETKSTPWENIANDELYRKLAEYRQGLYNYAVKKFGEEMIDKLLNGQ